MATITIPHPDELRQQIAERQAELAKLKKLFRLATAAEQARPAIDKHVHHLGRRMPVEVLSA